MEWVKTWLATNWMWTSITTLSGLISVVTTALIFKLVTQDDESQYFDQRRIRLGKNSVKQ